MNPAFGGKRNTWEVLERNWKKLTSDTRLASCCGPLGNQPDGSAARRHDWGGFVAVLTRASGFGRLVMQVRARQREVEEGRALYCMTWYRHPEGNLLDTHVASVEMLHVIRSTVAIARYVVFVAPALHHQPA